MSVDIIKEYLVRVGFDVDDTSVNGAKQKIQNLENLLGRFAQSTAGKLTTAFGAVGVVLGTATLAIGKFADAMAVADQQAEIMARRLLITEKNARSLKTVMDAMKIGSIEDLQDINLNPELRKQFLALRGISQQLEPGEAAQKGLATIRSVGYAFDRLQVVISYALLNIAGRLGQYLEKPIAALNESLGGIEDWFMNNFDKIADAVAQFMASIVQLTMAFGKILGFVVKIGGWALKVFDGLRKAPMWLKQVAVGLTAIGAAVLSGPWGMIVAAVSALTLLVEDYMVWKLGGKSALGDQWGGIEGFVTNVMNVLESINTAVVGIADKLGIPKVVQKVASGIAKGAATGAALGTAFPLIPYGPLGGAVLGGVAGGVAEGFNWWDQEEKAKKKDMQIPAESAAGRTLAYLRWVAKQEGLKITSADSGHHNRGSKHYLGQAIDFDHRGIGADKIKKLKDIYGLNILDERRRPAGQAVWGGSHYHASIDPQKAAQMREKLGGGTTNVVNINVNGAGDPQAVANNVFNKMENYVALRDQRSMAL